MRSVSTAKLGKISLSYPSTSIWRVKKSETHVHWHLNWLYYLDERLYPFGSMQNDQRVPSTDKYVRKCFAANVAGDGLNFRENIFNTLFVSNF